MDQDKSDTTRLSYLYSGSDIDQDKPDTTRLTDLYLGSQHVQDVTDQLQRYNQVNRLYLEPQYVQDHQMAKSSQKINIDQ